MLTVLSLSDGKIMRNNALITKMVSNFRNDNEISMETDKPITMVNTMQNLLCKNFPSIPCDVITKDETLKMLIERSIQQIDDKKNDLDRTRDTTQNPGQLMLFPVINNEDLSNFILMDENKQIPKKTVIHKRKDLQQKKINRKKASKKSKQTSVYSRKKIRKFYPHKVKYKDKAAGAKEEYKDRTEERLSMSVELPDMTLTKKHQHFAYKMEPEEPPVWRIDYMKHGEPGINMFDLSNAMFKGSKKFVDDTGRRDVLHPDLYINKNYVGKKMIGPDINSDLLE